MPYPDLPCSTCGQLMYRSKGSLPDGQATCRPCRAARRAARALLRPVGRGNGVSAASPCQVCGTTFESSRPNASYCSVSCRNRRPRQAQRDCEVCALPYQPSYTEQRACSRACGLWIKYDGASCPVEWADCGMCAGPYAKATERGFGTCSKACADAARRLLRAGPPKDDSWKYEERECPTCATRFAPADRGPFVTTGTLYCSYRCGQKAAKRRRRVREAGTYGDWLWSDFMRVARRFNYCCAYCGQKPDGQLDPDHVVPLSRGGANIIGNILPACRPCNGQKSANLLHEWEERRAALGLPPRATSWAPEDRRYFHLTQSNRGITPNAA